MTTISTAVCLVPFKVNKGILLFKRYPKFTLNKHFMRNLLANGITRVRFQEQNLIIGSNILTIFFK